MDRAGLFELANHGTLLLDELNSMPYELQSKLLRVLQESYIRRVGGSEDIPVDVRVITTVNEDPVDLIRQGKLRQDLYYRLSVVTLNIPPLRERRGDIPYLAQALIEKHHAKMGKRLSELPRDVLRQLMEYDYPGNVRELENILIQAMFMMDGDRPRVRVPLSAPQRNLASARFFSVLVQMLVVFVARPNLSCPTLINQSRPAH